MNGEDDGEQRRLDDDGALECLSMVLDLHESDGEPSAFCVECSQSWPCATVRLIRAEATA